MIVTPVSPSSSVTTAVRVLSSALVPVMDAEPISLMFVTVTVNDCVVVWPLITLPLPSKLLAVRVTLLAPTAASAGVPVNLPVELE